MPNHKITPLSYAIERSYPVPPAVVFSRWLLPEMRSIWEAAGADWTHRIVADEPRIGGHSETVYARPGGPGFRTRADYLDIVPEARIVYAFSLLVGDRPVACSLTSLEVRVGGRGTLLTLHEAVSLLDDADVAALKAQGIVGQLDPEPLGHGVLRALPALGMPSAQP